MLPCVPHLINIAQLGGLGRKEQRGIWRAGEAVFAHESEILSEVPAEPERGCARRRAESRRGDAEVAAGSGEARMLSARMLSPRLSPSFATPARVAFGRPRPRLAPPVAARRGSASGKL